MKLGSTDISKVYLGSTEVTKAYLGSIEVYSSTPYDANGNYLTFKAKESGTFQFTNAVNYSLDDGATWVALAANTATPSLSANSTIMWKATLTPSSTSGSQGIGTFSSTGSYEAMGNPLSLISGDNFANVTTLAQNYTFFKLFYESTGLTKAHNIGLPATTLSRHCYRYMFSGCSNLTTTPKLPAMTMANDCYENMFQLCTSLTVAPDLPATALATACYSGMFIKCSNLVTVPLELPSTTLASSCYSYMFQNCANIETAPILPASTLQSSCYLSMFRYCYKLNYIKCLATDISASSCTNNWVQSVKPSGTFVKASTMSGWGTGNAGIPSGWTIENAV